MSVIFFTMIKLYDKRKEKYKIKAVTSKLFIITIERKSNQIKVQGTPQGKLYLLTRIDIVSL